MAARWQVFLPPCVSSGLTGSHWRAAITDDCYPLFTDVAGNISFLSLHSHLLARDPKDHCNFMRVTETGASFVLMFGFHPWILK